MIYFSIKNTMKSRNLYSNFTVCNDIISAVGNNEVIQIKYNHKSIHNASSLNKFIGLYTKGYGQSIFFPQNSGEITEVSEGVANVLFYLPIVGDYQAELVCAPPAERARVKSDLTIKKSFQVELSTQTFTDKSEYSRILCHGTNFSNRWCEVKNLVYFDDNLSLIHI